MNFERPSEVESKKISWVKDILLSAIKFEQDFSPKGVLSLIYKLPGLKKVAEADKAFIQKDDPISAELEKIFKTIGEPFPKTLDEKTELLKRLDSDENLRTKIENAEMDDLHN